ncbi:MAG: biotin/lipoyl-binding protein, partial [bacterium]|nr:biotin/lipoyl-binding protein [Candidatus Colisoma equi]
MKRKLLFWIVLAAVLCGAFALYDFIASRKPYDPTKFVMGNGRIEATEVTISAMLAGRIEKIYIEEGDLVTNGQKLVEIQTDELRADLLKARASLAEAEAKVREAEIT